MKIAFQYPHKGHIIENLITWWTHSKYCHVALLFEDEFALNKYTYDNLPKLFSADTNQVPNVGFVYWNETSKQIFDVYEINYHLNESKILQQALKYVGAKYDYIGIFFNFIIPLRIEEPKRWFCSEICSYLLKKNGVPLKRHHYRYSPGSLYRELKNKGLINLVHKATLFDKK